MEACAGDEVQTMLRNIPKTEKVFYLIYMAWIVLLLLQYLSGGILMIVLFPIFWLYLAFIPFSIIFSILLFLDGETWISRQRVGALLFLLPSMFLFVFPFIGHQFKIYTSSPTDELIKSYIQTEQLGGPFDIDTSLPFTRYDKEEKVLELKIRIDPEKYLEHYNTAPYVLEASAARPFISRLSHNYLSVPSRISTVTKVPKTIIVKGYWGEEPVLTGYFTRGLKEYKLVEPYPQLALVGSQGIWYLEYESNGIRNRVMIERVEGGRL
ncbi:hypothetical protein [Cohnella cellulosilytica]|uniref:hypothetical protein n=1 Tax=Cohnella cellulosilytica TaxID=986710 RepID=UPI003605AE70